MANNGYLVAGSCLGIQEKAINSCQSLGKSYTCAIPHYYVGNSSHNSIGCSCSTSGASLTWLSMPAYDCEIPGSPMNEIQQIEAINAMFPAAVAILATAWAFKWLRNMVYEWLKERNQND